jgi:hypothetical protein
MERKRAMAYPSSAHPSGQGRLSSTAPSPRCPSQGAPFTHPQTEGEHQLEKLEFALAVALTRGDKGRSDFLRDQIAALGGNHEEPGT